MRKCEFRVNMRLCLIILKGNKMPRFVWIGMLCLSLLVALPLMAQDDTTTTDTTTEEPTSTVSYFFIACDNQAVFDLEGFADDGDDLYIQVFDNLGGTGNAITPLVRVPVAGDYQVSQVLEYNEGTLLTFGQFASATIAIGSETDSENITFTEAVDDAQDGCVTPTFPTTDSISTGNVNLDLPPTAIPPLFVGGNNAIPDDFSVFDTLRALESANAIGTATPNNNGLITSDTNLGGAGLTSVQLVTSSIIPDASIRVGADESTIQAVPISNSDGILTQAVNFQQAILTDLDPSVVSPNVVFAECDNYEGTAPSFLNTGSEIIVYWAWFATSRELLAQHNAAAEYSVFFTSNAGRQLIQNSFATDPILLANGNFYTIYAASVGTGFPAGNYRVEYNLTWRNAISDGLDDYGPGTDRPSVQNSCTFTVGGGVPSLSLEDLTSNITVASTPGLNAAIDFQRALTAETLEGGTGRRTTSPGVIFAECDTIAGTAPATVFDNENLTVYWAWFANSSTLLAQHTATARYQISVTDANGNRTLIPAAEVSNPIVLADGNTYLVYAADIGTLPAGSARVDYTVSWSAAISDGFEDFGPGTANPSLTSSCSFTVSAGS